MRIAVSGAHATGKTTLIAELARVLPGYAVLEEPYHSLASEGHAFEPLPSLDDFELLLERSVSSVTKVDSTNVLFDRAPVDYLAYLEALSRDPGALTHWVPRVAEAMARLDLVVFVPIERPDRIGGAATEWARLRRRVNRTLATMLLDDEWGFGARVAEVSGTPGDRAEQVCEWLARTAF